MAECLPSRVPDKVRYGGGLGGACELEIAPPSPRVGVREDYYILARICCSLHHSPSPKLSSQPRLPMTFLSLGG